ncbi:MAG: hypothetical protein EAY70_01140 [Sphingomonadales bacterium]|nr:MAG: hypothetical protein EAY70_01140 [Sphingomonadales bacterium]
MESVGLYAAHQILETMMMQRAFASREEQRAFMDELQTMLRQGKPDAALAQVRCALEPFAAAGSHLASLALTLDPRNVELLGWEWFLSQRFSGSDATAIGIDFSWPGHFSPRTTDADGNLEPVLETNYYEDMDIVHFSTATREQILAGYSGGYSEWQGHFSDIEVNIEVKGMERLYGAIWSARRPGDSDDAAGDIYVLAACASAIILHLVVRDTIRTRGLGKPMAVLVGSNEDFPFFDATVMSFDESRPYVRLFEQAAGNEHRSTHRDAGYRSAESSQRRAKRDRPSVDDILKDHPEFTDFARLAEQSLRHVRKPKDVLPALGNLAASALADFLNKRR